MPPNDKHCTTQCQLHRDIKEILDKHDLAIFGNADSDGMLTKISSFMTVKTIVYSCVGLIITAFLTAVIGFVWRGAK